MGEPSQHLLEIAGALSDSTPVDWIEAEVNARDEEERGLVRLLRDIGRVAEVHREFQRPLRSADAELAAGTSWAHLEILEKVGEGGSAEVFRARDRNLSREVALKLFHLDWPTSAEHKRALMEEGRHLAQVKHENVVTIYGADEHASRVGIWMEYIEGRTLNEIVSDQGPFSALEATLIGIELCQALAAVHKKELVHGDVKAQNVKRQGGGRIVLMDFSTSRAVKESSADLARGPGGTPLYMAPELLLLRKAPSVKSDIYSLGALLFYLVTGAFPVPAKTLEELRRAHERRTRLRLRDERPDLPETFIRTVERATSANPENRFESAGAFEEALSESSGVRREIDWRRSANRREADRPRATGETLPVPVEDVRSLANVARRGGFVVGTLAAVELLGFVTSMAQNVTLGRPSDFTSDSVGAWFLWGTRSLLGPVVYMTLVAAFVALLILVSRFFLRICPPAHRWVGKAPRRLDAIAGRLGLDDPAVLAQALFVAGCSTLAAVCWRYFDLIRAVVSQINIDPLARLDVIRPENASYYIEYRHVLDVVILALAVAWFRVFRRWSRKEVRAGIFPLRATLVVLGAAVVLVVFPYRTLWGNEFERITFDGERAYIIGEKQGEVLIYCRDARPPRNRIVARGDTRIHRLNVMESIFSQPGAPPSLN